MLKTFYVQLEKDTNKITDCISYAYSDYEEVQLEIPLPPNILAGCYKLESGSAVYVQDWDKDAIVESLRNDMNNAIMELSMAIAMGGTV